MEDRGGDGGRWGLGGGRAKVSGGPEYTSTFGHAKDQAGKRGRTRGRRGGGDAASNAVFLQIQFYPLQVLSLDIS